MKWFATHIDRDFQYGGYGNGKPRMYVSNDIYTSITPLGYKDGVLTVKDGNARALPSAMYTLMKQFRIFKNHE